MIRSGIRRDALTVARVPAANRPGLPSNGEDLDTVSGVRA